MPSLDVIIFVWFLAIYLIVGFIWRPKHNRIDDYAKENYKFSTAKIVSAMVSGWVGSGFLFLFITETIKHGFYFFLPNFGVVLTYFIMGIFIAPRISEFIGKSSIAEVTKELWGTKVAFITAICYILVTLGILTIQLHFTSIIIGCFGISPTYALTMSGITIIFYCIIANPQTATFSDILQFVSHCCFIPVGCFVIWQALSDSQIPWEILKNRPDFNLNQIFDLHNNKMYRMFGSFALITIPRFGPFIFQNISMSQNTRQSARAFKISGLIILGLQIYASSLAFLITFHNPDFNPNDLGLYFFNNYISPSLKIVLAIGSIIIIMSSASFLINTSSKMLVQNILEPIKLNKIYNQRLILIYFAITAGLISTYITFKLDYMLSLVFFGIYATLISTPFFFAIFGFRSSELSVLIGMAASAISMIIYQWKFTISEIDFFVPGIITNIIFLFGSHYILKQTGGWLGIKGKREFDEFTQTKRRERQKFIYDTFGLSFLDFCKQGLPTSSANISFFGAFSFVSILLTQITLPDTITYQHPNLINFLYPSAFIIATNLVFYPIWPQILKKSESLSIIWLLSVLYISIIIPAIFVFVSNFMVMQMIIALINVIAIFVMLKWNISVFLIFSGWLSASVYVYFFAKGINVEELQIKISYLLLFLIGILISFLKPYVDRNQKLELIPEITDQLQNISEQTLNLLILKQDMLDNLNQEIKTPIENIGTGAVSLHQNRNNLEKLNRDSTELIYKEYKNLQSYIDKLTKLSKFGTRGLILNYQDINFEELVENAIHQSKNYKSKNDNLLFKINTQAKHLIITCDPSKIFQSLEYLIKNAVNFTIKGTIEVLLENQDTVINKTMTQMIKCSIIDEGIGIPEDQLEYIFGAFAKSSYTSNHGKGLGLALCQRIIQLHHGMIWAKNNKTKPGATFTFMIPRRPILS